MQFKKIACCALVCLPMAAIAGPGKAGWWESTTQIDAQGDFTGGKLTPQQRAMMENWKRQHGGQVSSKPFVSQHCVTPEDAAKESFPPVDPKKECNIKNVVKSGNTYSGDIVCTGETQGTGSGTLTYEDSEHYTLNAQMKGTKNGQPFSVSTKQTGKWLSADCGK